MKERVETNIGTVRNCHLKLC